MNSLNFFKQGTDKQKKFFAIIMAGIVTLVIVGIWYSASDLNSEMVDKDKSSKSLSSVSPFKIIKDEFSKAFSEIGDSVSDMVATATESIPSIIDETASSSLNVPDMASSSIDLE